MGYVESNLLPDEEIVFKANLHWKIFLKSLFILGAGILLAALQPVLGEMGLIIGGIFLVIGVFMLIQALIEYKTSEFAVTTKRVIIKVGLLRRRTLELLLRQVEAISVDQSVTGRIFNFGSLTLTGTGGVREVFHNIAEPLEFRKRIHGQAT